MQIEGAMMAAMASQAPLSIAADMHIMARAAFQLPVVQHVLRDRPSQPRWSRVRVEELAIRRGQGRIVAKRYGVMLCQVGADQTAVKRNIAGAITSPIAVNSHGSIMAREAEF